MQLSVVVPTLNGRERLASCLNALGDAAPDAEVVVVNGPSTDGTTGMLRAREDVSVLLEIPERNVNVARNAGIGAASGDVVALLDDSVRVAEEWGDVVADAVADGADAVTGPRHRELPGGVTPDGPESGRIGRKSISYFDGGNVAFTREAVLGIDGFDEYLQTGGARDAAQRLANQGRRVDWAAEMAVRHDLETDGGSGIRSDVPRPNASPTELDRDWGWKYRSFAYRLTKNFGPRPTVLRRIVGQAVGDAVDQGTDVFRGESLLSSWAGTGRTVLAGIGRGGVDGLRSRWGDRSEQRNPHGLSDRDDRTVAQYDWR